MSKKSEYKCILYEKGDKVKSRFPSLFEEQILEVENTDVRYVGMFAVQFLKFVGRPADITDLSNYYLPTAETTEKYKDGFKYFNEVKVKAQSESKTKGSKVETTFTRKFNPKTDSLTEEDLKPKIAPKGLFNGRPPIKKEI